MTLEERATDLWCWIWSQDRDEPKTDVQIEAHIADAIRAAVAEEREACAVLADRLVPGVGQRIAAAIRARKDGKD